LGGICDLLVGRERTGRGIGGSPGAGQPTAIHESHASGRREQGAVRH